MSEAVGFCETQLRNRARPSVARTFAQSADHRACRRCVQYAPVERDQQPFPSKNSLRFGHMYFIES
jgi:hypothetical protein